MKSRKHRLPKWYLDCCLIVPGHMKEGFQDSLIADFTDLNSGQHDWLLGAAIVFVVRNMLFHAHLWGFCRTWELMQVTTRRWPFEAERWPNLNSLKELFFSLQVFASLLISFSDLSFIEKDD